MPGFECLAEKPARYAARRGHLTISEKKRLKRGIEEAIACVLMSAADGAASAYP